MSIKKINSETSDDYWDVVLDKGSYAEVDGFNAHTGITTSGVLSTAEVRECMALAVCDPVEETGYMIHLPVENMNQDEVRASLSNFATEVLERSNPENLEAAVTGSTSIEEDLISDPTEPENRMSEQSYDSGGLARLCVRTAKELLEDGRLYDRTSLNTPDFIEVSPRGSFLFPKNESEHDYDYMY